MSECPNCKGVIAHYAGCQLRIPISTLATNPREEAFMSRAITRIRAIAKGASINGTYRQAPEDALASFRADLLRLVGDK